MPSRGDCVYNETPPGADTRRRRVLRWTSESIYTCPCGRAQRKGPCNPLAWWVPAVCSFHMLHPINTCLHALLPLPWSLLGSDMHFVAFLCPEPCLVSFHICLVSSSVAPTSMVLQPTSSASYPGSSLMCRCAVVAFVLTVPIPRAEQTTQRAVRQNLSHGQKAALSRVT